MEAESPIKKEKKSNKLYGIIAIVLFVTAGILGWQFLEQKALVKEERSEKSEIKAELGELLAEYQNVTTDNEGLRQQLDEKIAEIEEMLVDIEKLEKLKIEQRWLMTKFKRENQSLRRILKVYLHEMDSMGKKITVLVEEKTEIASNLTSEIKKSENLTREKENLSGQVALGSQFKLYQMVTSGIRMRGAGKEKEESRARRVEKIKVCFTIAANALTTPGERDFYLRVADDKGNVFPKDGDSTNVFTSEGVELAFSGRRKLNYQNKAEEICIYFKKAGLNPGTYSVDIFADGLKVGETGITLE
ncbi:MAG: hypothetical protein JKY52_00815 [Flavobacteriales bacterium]|nr:hypothetical protein [Flavobacteriales bacterium]